MRWDADKYDEVKSPQVDAGKELITMAKVRDTDSILDIGCGTGKLTVELARLASKGFVTGIDTSEEMLQKARTVSGDLKHIRLINIQAQSMGFSEMFDLVFSNSTLQWIKEQRKVVGLMHKSFKKGGRIACQLPAKNFCKEFFGYSDNAIALLGFEKYFKKWQSPWYLPDKEEYQDLLEDAGFQGVDVFYRDYRIVFDSINGGIQWWASAGLRPYLEMLPPGEQEYFKYAVAMNYENNRTEKGIEFGFRRLFAFAVK
jgi:trans-aconitate 2-methyltransferase